MTTYPLPDGTVIEVPSLGFGRRWRKVRDLLTELTLARRGEPDLERENTLWRALFIESQSRLGYSRQECDRHLGLLGYPQRHEYEQLLLFGEIACDASGAKKNAAPSPRPDRLDPSWPGRCLELVRSLMASCYRESLRKPTSASSAPGKPTGCPPASAFWTRPSPPPTPPPASPCSLSSE